jgi:hypothetical protein
VNREGNRPKKIIWVHSCGPVVHCLCLSSFSRDDSRLSKEISSALLGFFLCDLLFLFFHNSPSIKGKVQQLDINPVKHWIFRPFQGIGIGLLFETKLLAASHQGFIEQAREV